MKVVEIPKNENEIALADLDLQKYIIVEIYNLLPPTSAYLYHSGTKPELFGCVAFDNDGIGTCHSDITKNEMINELNEGVKVGSIYAFKTTIEALEFIVNHLKK